LSLAASLALAQEATKLKLRAILWKRQSIEDGGLFVKYYAVLEKGRLDFYHREKVRRARREAAGALARCVYVRTTLDMKLHGGACSM
jgi:hypothetical protein